MSHKTTTIIAAFNFIGEAVAAFVAKQLGETPAAPVVPAEAHAVVETFATTLPEIHAAEVEQPVVTDAVDPVEADEAPAASTVGIPTSGEHDNANKKRARIVATALRRVACKDYAYRTLDGIAAKAGVSASEAEAALRADGSFTFKTRRRDGAKLVGMFGDRPTMKAVAKVLGRLADPTYNLRSATALGEGVDNLGATLAIVASHFTLTTKTRRADGVKLYAIAA